MEQELNQFREEGFCILDNEDLDAHKIFMDSLSNSLGIKEFELPNLHTRVDKSDINSLRLKAFAKINALVQKNELYFKQAETFLSLLFFHQLHSENL